MAKVISLDNVIDSSTKFNLDFYKLNITGTCDLPAKITFLAIMEYEDSMTNPFDRVLSCMPPKDKQEIESLMRKIKQEEAENKDNLFYVAPSLELVLSKVNMFLLKNELGSLRDLNKLYIKRVVVSESKHTIELLKNMINQAKSNGSLNVEFKVSNESDGLSLKHKESLASDILNTNDINQIAHLIFQYYHNSSYTDIYDSLQDSLKDFFERIK